MELTFKGLQDGTCCFMLMSQLLPRVAKCYRPRHYWRQILIVTSNSNAVDFDLAVITYEIPHYWFSVAICFVQVQGSWIVFLKTTFPEQNNVLNYVT